GRTHPAGALLVADLDEFVAGGRKLHVLFEPTASTALEDVTCTRDHIVMTVLEDGSSKLVVAHHGDDGSSTRPFGGLPEFGSIHAAAVDDEAGDELWLVVTDYLSPSTLMLGDVAPGAGAPEVLRSEPEFFDASTHVTEQHFATS